MSRNATATTALQTPGETEECPREDLKLIARTLGVVGDAWSLLIVWEALAGTSRFGQFQRRLGLAPNILAARLRALVEHGILEAHASAQRADWHDYVLTEKGGRCTPCWPRYGNGEAITTWGASWTPPTCTNRNGLWPFQSHKVSWHLPTFRRKVPRKGKKPSPDAPAQSAVMALA